MLSQYEKVDDPERAIRLFIYDGFLKVNDTRGGLGDWPEDFGDENGFHVNRCRHCKSTFIGNKRRVTCRVCDTQAPVFRCDVPTVAGRYWVEAPGGEVYSRCFFESDFPLVAEAWDGYRFAFEGVLEGEARP